LKECEAKLRKDSYLLGLTAATMYKLKRHEEGNSLAADLIKFQKEDGSVSDQETTITKSGGVAKVIESTGIAVLAWLHDTKYFDVATKAVEFLASQCKGGSFSSTQATVLALKAIVTYDQKKASPLAEGSVVARLNGQEIECIGFDKTAKGTIQMPSFADKFSAGTYDLEIEMIQGSKMPYTFTVEYFSPIGVSSDECVVDFSANLSTNSTNEGEGLEVDVKLANKTDKGQPMTVAIIGIPGGCEFRHEKLQELVKSKTIDYYETNGRYVTLYWRCLAPSENKSFKIDLIAAVPGTYTGPASKAYLYYTDEHKKWLTGLSISISPK